MTTSRALKCVARLPFTGVMPVSRESEVPVSLEPEPEPELEPECLGARLERFGSFARELAARRGKTLIVAVEGAGLRFDPRAWGSFWAAFGHVVRNAVEHGLEPSEERERSGKEPAGILSLAAQVREHGVVLVVEDDGRGIDWRAIAASARARGLPTETRQDLDAALFVDGISAGAGGTPSLGLGMGTLRGSAAALEGIVEIVSQRGGGTTVRFTFPRAAFLAPARARLRAAS